MDINMAQIWPNNHFPVMNDGSFPTPETAQEPYYLVVDQLTKTGQPNAFIHHYLTVLKVMYTMSGVC